MGYRRQVSMGEEVSDEPTLLERRLLREISKLQEELKEARDVARILAHAYTTDNRPPDRVVSLARSYKRGDDDREKNHT